MRRDVILSGAVRTPIGKFGGGLSSLTAVELGTQAARVALDRAGVRPEAVDHTIFGHARQAGCGPNPARQVAVASGVPVERPACTVNQACLSGMQAVIEGLRLIRLGEAEVVLAGGMEAMSRVPFLFNARWGAKMGHQRLEDAMYRDGFVDPICGKVMGATAETLARKYGISREEQDLLALRSQQRYAAAHEAGRHRAEIFPVEVPGRKGTTLVEEDEHPRLDAGLESLAKLKPVFDPDNGSVTAGNSSGITDGAAAMLVMSADAAKRLGADPMARIAGYRVVGVDPEVMGIGPVPAVRELEKTTRVPLARIELVELNEAFAAQVLAVDRELELDMDRVNVNGGAIALGHPIGCTGARIVVTLLHEMIRRDAANGLATLCVSGGMGGAMLLERPASH